MQMVGSALGNAANIGMASAYANPSMPKPPIDYQSINQNKLNTFIGNRGYVNQAPDFSAYQLPGRTPYLGQ